MNTLRNQTGSIIGTIETAVSKARPYVIGAMVVVSALCIAATFQWTWALELSAFAFALAKISLAVMVWLLVDRYVLHSFNTLLELRRGNIAVAIVVAVAFASIAFIAASS